MSDPVFLGSITGTVTSSNTLLLPPPSVGECAFYAVNLGTDGTDPNLEPDFAGEIATFTRPYSGGWGSGPPSFVLGLRGSLTAPTLEWRWAEDIQAAWVAFFFTTCDFALSRYADVEYPYVVYNNRSKPSPYATSAFFVVRSLVVTGGDGTLPPVDFISVPEFPNDPVEGYFPVLGTPSASMHLSTNPSDMAAEEHWVTNGPLGPYYGWGVTWSVLAPTPDGNLDKGWVLGLQW